MIKLVVNPDTQALTRNFDKDVVIIGSATSLNADLTLPNEKLQDVHIKITRDGEKCTIFNIANDPFVTLNGLPFGKKTLHHDDLIQIGSTSIRFEIHQEEKKDEEEKKELIADTRNKLPEILEKTISSQMAPKTPSVHANPFNASINSPSETTSEPEPEPKEDQEGEPLSFDLLELMRQVEQLEPPETHHRKEEEEEPIHEDIHQMTQDYAAGRLESRSLHSVHRTSLKDDYLKHLEDENQTWGNPKADKTTESLTHRVNWKFLLRVFLALLLIGAIVVGTAYVFISDQTEEEEVKAARGVADVVMALTYAQIKQIKPQNQNWSDPEFIKNNLIAVLATPYLSLANFDTHGQFNNSPFILRIYTSSDLSQFLVIAQPAPSLMQWFIPKSSIVVDSNAMEMRKIIDVKALNRLLVNANTLDGVNAAEISFLVKQGDLIAFSDLTNKKENVGFYPPKALALIRPGAQHLIYNAPRYYPLGEELMKKGLDLIENPFSQYDPTLLQQEIAALSKFSDLVLYSSQGLQHSLRAQKALSAIVPQKKFLVAYLQFNPNGYIVGSHLLMDDPTDFSSPHTPSSSSDSKEEQKETPFKATLAALVAERQQALEPIGNEMVMLLYNQTKADQEEFVENFQKLFERYREANVEQQTKISDKLSAMYEENPEIPLSQFLTEIKTAGLATAVHDKLKDLQQETVPFLTTDQVAEQLQKIEDSSNWEDLDKNISETADLLKLEQMPDPDKLISYQNAARAKVIQKLTQFLLKQEEAPTTIVSFDEKDRESLTHILKMAWIDEQDANDYLKEFDNRSEALKK